MAADDGKCYEIYWTREESVYSSDSEGVLHSFAPGVDQPGNRRRTTATAKHRQRRNAPSGASGEEEMMEGRSQGRGRDGKLGKQDRRKDKQTKTRTNAPPMERINTEDKPSLKDLRPEDKKRIANLIRELAKVGEEKDVIAEQMNVERRSYEDKVGKLQQHLSAVVKERELTQAQYLECQKLLAEYQSQLATEQEKLAASLHRQHGSPPKLHVAVQSPEKGTATNQSCPQPNGFPRETPRPTVQPTTGRVARGHPNGYPSALLETGLRYPGTRSVAPSQPGGNRSSQVDWNGNWNGPPGTRQGHPAPSTQLHPRPPSRQNPEFNPALASTGRCPPARAGSDGSWAEPRAAVGGSGTPAMYVSCGSTGGYVLRPGLGPGRGGPPVGRARDPPGTPGPRSPTGDFRPLQPEPEIDFESQGSRNSGEYVAGVWRRRNGTEPRDGLRATHGDDIHASTYPQEDFHPFPEEARPPTLRTAAEQRRHLLERQRQQLQQEQAWLRRRLRHQEATLRQKQGQLARERPGRGANGVPVDDVPEWEEPDLFDAISTNYPPTPSPNLSPAESDFENPARRLRLGGDASHTTVAAATGRRHLTPTTRGEAIEGYASLYPNTRPQHSTHDGGRPDYTAGSRSSSPTLVDQSTSPLSPARVYVTPAPALPQETSRAPVKARHQPRRAVSLPQSPRYHSEVSEKKRNVTHLSDLIAEMESPAPPDTPGDASRDAGGARRVPVTTPDLFLDTDAEMQESRILEDIFFL